ncbi:unnamed protein product [Orchesella dallaii]|uniref:Calcium-activated chloride channel N-terminal domain-containing protein n=1 Tax=Orchesella dallaii TaxID=48710 RepID=A0ABP1PQL7_9HEXA
MKKETFLIPIISLLFAIFSQHVVKSKTTTRIKFESGLYNGIVIGIDGDNTTDCVQLLNNLKAVLPIFSSKLYEATSGKARIGTVQILLPSDWTNARCGLSSSEIIEGLPHYSYPNSDLKISRDHPFAQSLPWTNQYKPCGQGGDSIIIPPQFLLDSVSAGGLSDSIKAQILLHEWTKFRYGAFDEIGYEGDSLFPPCYSRTQNRAQLTCCTKADLSSVPVDVSACTLSQLMGNKERLVQDLSQSPSSVMSSPYIDNVTHFCDEATHNGWSNTKQNVYCKRKSVSEVVNEHPDFKSTRSVPHQWQQDPLKIQFVKHSRLYEPAYAFVIDDSLEMLDGFNGVHIKQSIAQFLEILELGTEIRVVVFTETEIVVSNGKQLNTEQDKEDILCYAQRLDIPCNNDLFDNVNEVRRNKASRQLTPVIEEVIFTLSSHASFSWNVLLFTGTQEVQDVSNSVQRFGATNHSISILTFDTSSEWLQWYGIPNTKNVLGIPHCSNPSNTSACSLLSTSFITDYLVSIFNDQQFKPRFLVKAAQVELPNTSGFRTRFEINWEPDQVKNVYFLVSLPVNASTAGNTLRLEHITSGAICRAKILLGYAYVVKFIDDDDGDGLGSNCSFQNGPWEAVLETSMPAAQMRLQVFLEPIDTFNKLIVTPSLGLSDLTKGIYPTTNLTSVFVNVKTDKDTPVLGAQVSLQVYHLSSPTGGEVEASKTIVLADNGQGADQTGNDGMYSAFLSGYSQTPAFHLLQVQVQTNSETKMVTSIQSPNAILLDEKMTQKCCGKTVKPLTTNSLPSMTLQTLHLGLQTIETFDVIQYPPGRIDTITIAADNDTIISLQFESVTGQLGEDNIMIQSVEACCVPSNVDSPPSESNCANNTTNCGSFRPPGEPQICYIDKEKLVNTFLNNDTSINLLVCALRAVSTNATGELSSGMFSVDVKAAVDALTTPECNNLSDGCLPKTIFWVMIGCLGLLLLIIILLLVGWCCYCSSQKKKAKVDEPPPKPMTSLPPPRTDRSVYYDRHLDDQPSSQQNGDNEPKIVKELFVNHAYIQDGDGEIKIIADSGEILRKPKNDNDDIMQNRNQIKTIPITTRPTSTTPIRPPSDNMQVFKPAPPPKPKTTMTRTSPHRSKVRRPISRPDIVHPNPMLRADSIHDMQQPQEYALQPATPVHPPQPSYSTFQPPTERVDPSIVYATVSRAGRLKPVSPIEKTATLPSRRVNIDPHYMVPHHSVKHIGPRQRDPLPNLYPPPQVQAYPSSDTESDAHHQQQQHYPGRPNRYSKPPAYPAGSQLFNQNQSTFGAEGGRGQNQAVNPAVSVAPVPPPRYGVAGGRSSVPPQDHHQMSSDPDEDSDEWDDEDFDFNPGISYA